MNNRMKTAAAIVGLGFLYFFYELYSFQVDQVSTMETERAALEAQVSGKQAEYTRLRHFVANIEAIKAEYRELSLQLKNALEHMPPDFRLSELLRKLSLLAQNSGVELVNFQPDLTETKPEGTFYATLAIKFELKGTFSQSLLFFDQVARLKRIISLTQLTVSRTQREQNAGMRQLASSLRASGSLTTFRFAE